MRRRPTLTPAAALILAGSLTLPAGCRNDADDPAARTAEQAVGIAPRTEKTKTVETTRDVIVEKETRVVDKATGEVISDKKEATPVTIRKEKQETTDVKVDVGRTSTSVTPK